MTWPGRAVMYGTEWYRTVDGCPVPREFVIVPKWLPRLVCAYSLPSPSWIWDSLFSSCTMQTLMLKVALLLLILCCSLYCYYYRCYC